MAKKLMQILAVEKAAKNASENEFTRIFRDVQKQELVSGFTRRYTSRTEEGERFPDEKKLVVIRANDEIKKLVRVLRDLFDLTATKDLTNCDAKADIVVDGKVLVKNVPATHLLFIEKKLVDILNFARKLPVLDAAENWTWDAAQSLWTSDSQTTVKTKKLTKHDVVVPATKEHPAQVKEYTEDTTIGTWSAVKQSGSLTVDHVQGIIERAEKLARAVKEAREEANTVPVTALSTSPILDYIFDNSPA
jgi:hypothetical protein